MEWKRKEGERERGKKEGREKEYMLKLISQNHTATTKLNKSEINKVPKRNRNEKKM